MGTSTTTAATAASKARDSQYRTTVTTRKACLHAPCAVPSVGATAAAGAAAS